MNYIKINQKGKAHKNGECEDAIYISPDKTVFCLADGVSNSRYGAVGAKKIVNICGKAFLSPEVKDLLKNDSVENVRNMVCDTIDNILTRLCQTTPEREKEAFASTFLALIKTDENDVTLLHAGDGAIFGRPKTNQRYFTTILSYPDNTPDGKVYSAGHPEQRNRMRVIRIKPKDYSSIMLCTDGFSEAYLVPSFQAYNIDTVTEAFKVRDDAALEDLVYREHIRERDISDDISCILCVMDDNVSYASDNGYKYTVTDEGDIFNVPHKHETISTNEPISVNQVEYNKSCKKHEKDKNPKHSKKSDILVYVIAVLILMFSIAMGVHIKESAEVNGKQAFEISVLYEQVNSLKENLKDVEKTIDTSETSDTENNEQTTSNETTSSYSENNSEAEEGTSAPSETVD